MHAKTYSQNSSDGPIGPRLPKQIALTIINMQIEQLAQLCFGFNFADNHVDAAAIQIILDPSEANIPARTLKFRQQNFAVNFNRPYLAGTERGHRKIKGINPVHRKT